MSQGNSFAAEFFRAYFSPLSLPMGNTTGEKKMTPEAAFLQEVFPEVDPAEQVISLHMDAVNINFPRSPWCNCVRCRSHAPEQAILGHHCILKTTRGLYYGWRPGSPDALTHPAAQPAT